MLKPLIDKIYCCLVTQSCPTLCDPMACSMPGLPVPHCLLKFAQIHVHCIMSSSHLILCHPFSSALSLSQHQGLFQWVSCSHQMTKILELQLQRQSFWWVFRVYFHYDWLVWSPCCPRDFQEPYPAPQFKGINSFMLCLLYGSILTSIHDYYNPYIYTHLWCVSLLPYPSILQIKTLYWFSHTKRFTPASSGFGNFPKSLNGNMEGVCGTL